MSNLRRAIQVGVVATVSAIAWFVWELHPWMPAGHALALGTWRFGDYEFQVWQRKNPDTFEPFADGLFVRYGTNQWRVFYFDIQDCYSPKIRLQQELSEVLVYRRGENRGTFDLTTQSFRRNGLIVPAAYITGNPPGNWWLEK